MKSISFRNDNKDLRIKPLLCLSARNVRVSRLLSSISKAFRLLAGKFVCDVVQTVDSTRETSVGSPSAFRRRYAVDTLRRYDSNKQRDRRHTGEARKSNLCSRGAIIRRNRNDNWARELNHSFFFSASRCTRSESGKSR